MTDKDGGPAFPVSYGPDGTPGYADGMTLLDYATIRFHAALLGAPGQAGEEARLNPDRAAAYAREHAASFLTTRTGEMTDNGHGHGVESWHECRACVEAGGYCDEHPPVSSDDHGHGDIVERLRARWKAGDTLAGDALAETTRLREEKQKAIECEMYHVREVRRLREEVEAAIRSAYRAGWADKMYRNPYATSVDVRNREEDRYVESVRRRLDTISPTPEASEDG